MKLLELLTSFSSEELRGAKKAIQSPLFNSNQRLELLFDILRKKHPNFQEDDGYKKKLFTKIFPTEKYNDYKLRRLFTELRELLEDYLLFTKMKKDSYRRKIALTKIYGERNIYAVFKKKTEQLLQNIEGVKYPDTQMLLDKAILMKDFYEHNGTSKLQEYEYLVKGMEAVHQYYFGERIITKLAYQALNRTWANPIELPVENELQFLESRFTEKESLNHLLYSKIWQLVETDNESLYKEISQLFESNIDSFTKTDKNAIFSNLINYCIAKINLGNQYFSNHLLDLYEKGLETKVLLDENGGIHYMYYKNIAMVAIRVEKFDWAEKFINDYEAFVEPAFREETKSFILGCLYFSKKEFGKSIDIFSKTNYKNINDIFTSKSILLRAYFEICLENDSYYSLFQSYNNAYYKYLTRSHISKDKKVRHQELVSFTKRVVSELNSTADFDVEKWIAKLEESEDFAFKTWCKKKLHELQERK